MSSCHHLLTTLPPLDPADRRRDPRRGPAGHLSMRRVVGTAASSTSAAASAASWRQQGSASDSGPASGLGGRCQLTERRGGVKIGLVTKTDSNPYFVKLRETAKAEADAKGAELIALAGQVRRRQRGPGRGHREPGRPGCQGHPDHPELLVGHSDAIKQARDAGVIVIALDTATDPADAVDATFATDNKKAGELQGQWVKAHARLDRAEGPDAGRHPRRHGRHLPPRRLSHRDGADRQTARRSSAWRTPTATRPRRRPRWRTCCSALRMRMRSTRSTSRPRRVATRPSSPPGLTDQITIGSIDGSCTGVANVKAGIIGATVMQFPKKMAEQGVDAVVEYANSGTKPSGFNNTGSQLITDKPAAGVESQDTTWGAENCWG